MIAFGRQQCSTPFHFIVVDVRGESEGGLTYFLPPLPIPAEIQRLGVNETAAEREALISHQPRDFLPVDGDFEVHEGFVRIDAHAVGG